MTEDQVFEIFLKGVLDIASESNSYKEMDIDKDFRQYTNHEILAILKGLDSLVRMEDPSFSQEAFNYSEIIRETLLGEFERIRDNAVWVHFFDKFVITDPKITGMVEFEGLESATRFVNELSKNPDIEVLNIASDLGNFSRRIAGMVIFNLDSLVIPYHLATDGSLRLINESYRLQKSVTEKARQDVYDAIHTARKFHVSPEARLLINEFRQGFFPFYEDEAVDKYLYFYSEGPNPKDLFSVEKAISVAQISALKEGDPTVGQLLGGKGLDAEKENKDRKSAQSLSEIYEELAELVEIADKIDNEIHRVILDNTRLVNGTMVFLANELELQLFKKSLPLPEEKTISDASNYVKALQREIIESIRNTAMNGIDYMMRLNKIVMIGKYMRNLMDDYNFWFQDR
jgi:hypothetical protein